MKKFWNWNQHRIRNEDTGEETVIRELTLYGTIAEESWFDDDITPAMFREELFAATGPVTVWINSPGGDCIAASQIYTMLMDYKGDVTVKIDGIAASAASVIAMAGTQVLMAPTALMMIHNPATIAVGDHEDMKKAIEMLEEVKESIINAYELKTSLSRTKLSHLMDAETWMNAQKAMELGFADGMLEGSTDDKAEAGSDKEIPAYAFSRKAVQMALLNKITAGTGKAPEDKGSQETVSEKTELPMGRSVEELKARLLTIKDFM